VLAGVIALSGVAGSFGAAVGLGSAYVFGMVAPLFVISLLWVRFDFRASRLFRPRSVTWQLGPVRRTVSATGLASGILLALMGAATMYIGLFKDSMPSPRGWQASVSATLQHYATNATHALSFVPGWAAAGLLVLVITGLARHALRQLVSAEPNGAEDEPDAAQESADADLVSEPEYEHAS
jgi:cytochrome c-type biogenesis protein